MTWSHHLKESLHLSYMINKIFNNNLRLKITLDRDTCTDKISLVLSVCSLSPNQRLLHKKPWPNREYVGREANYIPKNFNKRCLGYVIRISTDNNFFP